MDSFIKDCTHFIQEQCALRGFKKVVLGLSGGVDSAVVAYLATLALGKNNVKTLLMPSMSSAQSHFDDALTLATLLDLEHKIIKLQPFQAAYMQNVDSYREREDMAQKLAMGNFCARMRMALLYDYASAQNALVLGTSNKSELLLGYGTIFGDLACALNPIGNLYKTQIFALAQKLSVPENIVRKMPSADLFANQSDEGDLGYSYSEIDNFLRAFVKLEGLRGEQEVHIRPHIKEALKREGFAEEMIESLSPRIWNNAFKRAMPLIFKGDFIL
ncbi:NAD+ synthase [Helicobacter marmotae]|uniref:NH(3)-dependent NAD(+) synthetase n=1 Tax=Helicobacter marmotae TaxID=152490 RepID=A0A3D8I2J5_9HELI|nr:NAD+ synthase [Helicobacter marmotae]RDU59307.1 NAD+ synthase [Helicobacter marmotae]